MATSMSLGNHFEVFISEQIQSGRYGSASEVMRDALRLLELREDKLKALRSALAEGEQSGFFETDADSLLNELNTEIDQGTA